MNEANEFNNYKEAYIRSGRRDSKDREIGYIIGTNDNGTVFAAWVQNARRVDGEWKEFGVRQRSKRFKTQADATRWAYQVANERISKLQS